MRRKFSAFRQVGAIMPLIAVSMTVIIGFVALAVDVGMMAVARSQCQNAADAAAMTGARTLNGDPSANYNTASVQPNALAAAQANSVAGTSILSSQLTVSTGSYTYNYTSSSFSPTIPAASADTPNLVEATVTASGVNRFGSFLGLGASATSATATAVHRPRDVAVVLDMSGSMRFDSLLGIPYWGGRTQSNNPETVYPQFGHYGSFASNLYTNQAATTISGYTYGAANTTVDTGGGAAVVKDYYQNALGASPVAAFTAAPDSYATAPAGDKPLMTFGSTTVPGKTVQSITSGAAFNGYTATPFTGYTGPAVSEFAGYTQGPRYWGKTFFIWPPDPRAANDWRTKFFSNPGTSTGVTDNTKLWDGSFNWQAPGSSSYDVNYTAILAWIKQSPNPFPNQLRSGRILYYDAIPTTINRSSVPPTDLNQRFWKLYIDYVLGVLEYSQGNYKLITPKTGYGDDVSWGTLMVSTKPGANYMSYTDNPERPLLHFWFGPMTMMDFLGCYNLYGSAPNSIPFADSGTAHIGPAWACKLGVQAAMNDVKNNHPNDFASLMFFNSPMYSLNDGGTFNRARQPLGRNYNRLSDALWFPLTTIDNPGTEVRPFDTANADVPRSSNGTATVMGLMLAYNQLSGNTGLRTWAPSPAPSGEAGGFGRQGAQKLVILETDGVANEAPSAGLTNAGAYNSYYNIRQPGEYPTYTNNNVPTQLYAVANQICALDTASPPGYSSTRKPVYIHCIAFGSMFEPSNGNPNAAAALTLLQNIQYIGGTQASASTALPSYKVIIGTPQQRMDNLRQAFSTIMQDGVQVSLIR